MLCFPTTALGAHTKTQEAAPLWPQVHLSCLGRKLAFLFGFEVPSLGPALKVVANQAGECLFTRVNAAYMDGGAMGPTGLQGVVKRV